MKIYHTSPAPITQIKKTGTFGECLCFSSDVYSMSVGAVVVYSLEIEGSEVIDAADFELSDAPNTVAHVASVLECDEYEALDYLTGSEAHADPELDWFVQGQMGAAAKEAGYKAARSQDEQGAVYIVPMFGREADLKA
jgi:hypothetical protein